MKQITITREDSGNHLNNSFFAMINSKLTGNIEADIFNIQSFSNAFNYDKKYKFGKGGHHIWFKEIGNDKRIGIIYYK